MKPLTPTQFKAARKKMGYTQVSLSELAQCSFRTIQQWESGKNPITMWVTWGMKILLQEHENKS